MALFKEVAIRLAVSGLTLATCGQAQEQPFAPAPEQGIASWYGASFDGLRSASGEIFDSGQLTAAHRTLPFGTKVRVRRLDSADSIVVRINDRGPFVDSRIIDLSYAAARQLGMTDPGLLRVALEVLENAETVEAPQNSFAVRAGAFRDPENARRTRDRMQEMFGTAGTAVVKRMGEYWCVLVGNTANQAEAEALVAKVRKSDEAFRSAYIVRLEQYSEPPPLPVVAARK
jgi:rare lipoprotein A